MRTMIRLYLPFFLALFILVVPKESEGQNGQLTQINSVKIVVRLYGESKDMGLTEDGIKDQILVLLRSKLPRLPVNKSALYGLLVTVQFTHVTRGGEKTDIFYGHIFVAVNGKVTQLMTNKLVNADLWSMPGSLSGPVNRSSAHDSR